MQPHVAVLGQIDGTDRWRDIERYQEAKQMPGVTVVRFDTSLNYLNVTFMKDQIRRLMAQDPHALVLDLSSVNDVDSTAADTLMELLDELDEEGIAIHLASYRGPVLEILDRTDIPERVAGVHEDVHEAGNRRRRRSAAPGVRCRPRRCSDLSLADSYRETGRSGPTRRRGPASRAAAPTDPLADQPVAPSP